MKKIFLILALCSITSFTHASIKNEMFNEDEGNIYEVFNLIRTIHRTTTDFSNLKNIYAISNFSVTPTYLDRLELNTKNNNKTAVVKYKTKDCNNLKDIKGKLIKLKLATEKESMSCKNNLFIAELKK
jgi:hypothetical protein